MIINNEVRVHSEKYYFLNSVWPRLKRGAGFLRIPLGIKGKKSQDKKNRAFRSGLKDMEINSLTYSQKEQKPVQAEPVILKQQCLPAGVSCTEAGRSTGGYCKTSCF